MGRLENRSWLWITICILSLCGQVSCVGKRHLPKEREVSSREKRGERVILTDASDAKQLRTVYLGKSSTQRMAAYSEVLGVPPRSLKNPHLYAFLEEWMGVPHRNGGQSRAGIDCSAFVGQLYRDVYGIQVPRTAEEMSNRVKRKYERQLREGDLVFFKFQDKSKVDHVGVYLANGRFVHVSNSRGVIISRLKDRWYYPYFFRCGSI